MKQAGVLEWVVAHILILPRVLPGGGGAWLWQSPAADSNETKAFRFDCQGTGARLLKINHFYYRSLGSTLPARHALETK